MLEVSESFEKVKKTKRAQTDLSKLLPDSPVSVLLDLHGVRQSENTQIRMREDSVISSLLSEGGDCNETKEGRIKSQLDAPFEPSRLN